MEEAGRRLGRGRRGHLRDLHGQDRHRRGGARDRAGGSEIRVEVGETVEVGVVLATISTDARPGQPHVSESSSPRGPARPRWRWRPRARRASSRATRPTRTRRRPPRRRGARPRAAGGRRYSPVVMRMAAEHDLDLSQIEGTGRGGRVSKRDVLAFLESGGGRRGRRAADAHRVALQARRAGAAEAARAALRPGARARYRRDPLAHAAVDRPRDGRVAADGGDVHHDRRGGHDARRRGPQAARRVVPADRRAGGDRDAPRPAGAQRHARRRRVHPVRRACTWASRSRSTTA